MSLLIEKQTCNSSNTLSGDPDGAGLQFFTLGGGLREESGLRRARHHFGAFVTSTDGPRAHLYTPTTTAWSLSYGSRVSCSWGFMFSCCIFFTSEAKTASAEAVESMQLACKREDLKPEASFGIFPPFCASLNQQNLFLLETRLWKCTERLC